MPANSKKKKYAAVGKAFQDIIEDIRAQTHNDLEEAAWNWLLKEVRAIGSKLRREMNELENNKHNILQLEPYALNPEKYLYISTEKLPEALQCYRQELRERLYTLLQDCDF